MTVCVVANPPVAGGGDFENHKFAGIAWDPRYGVFQRNGSVTVFCVGLNCTGHSFVQNISHSVFSEKLDSQPKTVEAVAFR